MKAYTVLEQAAPSSIPVSAPAGGGMAAPVARWLRITVTRHGRMVVQVCFPSYAVLSLADLVPDDVRVRIVEQQVDLEQVAAAAASRGCPPGELVALTAGEHGVRVWLD